MTSVPVFAQDQGVHVSVASGNTVSYCESQKTVMQFRSLIPTDMDLVV